MVQISIEHGYCEYSSIGFASFGVILGFGGDKLSYQFGTLALMLLDKVFVKDLIPYAYITHYGLITPFYRPLHVSLSPLKKSIKFSYERNMYEGVFTSINYYVHYCFFCGYSMPRLKDIIDDLENSNSLSTNAAFVISKVVSNLMDENAEDPAALDGVLDFKIDNEKKQPITTARILTICCVVAHLFNDYKSALKCLDDFKEIDTPFTFHHAICVFYEALISLELAKEKSENTKHIEDAEECIAKLRSFSENSPSNFLNKIYLLEAELLSIRGNDVCQIKSCYDQAIALSKKYGFIHEEAISCENAGRFYLKSNLVDHNATALKYLLKSYKCYASWGATSKMKQLTEQYPMLKKENAKAPLPQDVVNELDIESETIVSMMSCLSCGSNNTKRVRYSIEK